MFNFLLSAFSWAKIKPNFMTSLNILWQGVLAIVIVIGLIMITTAIMNKIANRKPKNPDDNGKE